MLRVGQGLKLHRATTLDNFGTVSKVERDGRFQVTFPSITDGKGRKSPRVRFWYPVTADPTTPQEYRAFELA